jgi:hypothetical protein
MKLYGRVPSLLIFGVLLAALCSRLVLGIDSHSSVIARGAGTTMIQGGTGSTGRFVPVLTTLAFHAEREGGTVTGAFECLARAPENNTGSGSAQFTVNAMYVTGQITAATVSGDEATLTGTATITGLGAGTNAPFQIIVRRGGPGATAVLTTEGSQRLVFPEILVEGSFQVFQKREGE